MKKLNKEIKTASKKAKIFYVGVLRMMMAAFKNKEIEKKGKGEKPELSDEEIIEILSKEAKKRKEATQIYSNAGRKDLADKELKEVLIIQNYSPAKAGFEEIEKIAAEVIEETNALSYKDFGRAMAAAVKKLKGRAEPASIAELIKKKLGG